MLLLMHSQGLQGPNYGISSCPKLTLVYMMSSLYYDRQIHTFVRSSLTYKLIRLLTQNSVSITMSSYAMASQSSVMMLSLNFRYYNGCIIQLLVDISGVMQHSTVSKLCFIGRKWVVKYTITYEIAIFAKETSMTTLQDMVCCSLFLCPMVFGSPSLWILLKGYLRPQVSIASLW